MKVDLGTTDELPEGFDKGVDISPQEKNGKIMEADLEKTWPFESDSVDHFRAHDIIEHLHDRRFTMNEMWRCLKRGGTVEIVVPIFPSTGSVQDPSHVSFWTRRSFIYYEDGHDYRNRFAKSYGIEARFKVVDEQQRKTIDGPKLRIVLKAVK